MTWIVVGACGALLMSLAAGLFLSALLARLRLDVSALIESDVWAVAPSTRERR
jgi:hypothetical protein